MATAEITYCEVPMTVEYEFVAGEAPILWGDNAHPGSPDCAEISSVLIGGVEVYEMLSHEQLDRIEEKILDGSGDSDRASYDEDQWQRRQDRAMEDAS